MARSISAVIVSVAIAAVLGLVGGPPASAQVAAFAVANPGNQSSAWDHDASLQMQASGGTQPYTWSATGLVPFTQINPSTGLISGSVNGPRDATYTVTVFAVDAAGNQASTTFQWRVFAGCAKC